MSPDATIDWILRRDEKDVTCTHRKTDRGIEVSVTFSGLPTAQRLTHTIAEARSWMGRVREAWEAAGWRPELT